MENERNDLVTTEEEMAVRPYDDRCESADESSSSGGLIDTVIKVGAGIVMGIAGTIIAIKHKQKKAEERTEAENEEVTQSALKTHLANIKKAKEAASNKVVDDEELEYFAEQEESTKK